MAEIRWNVEGFYQLRTMPATRALLELHGQRVMAAANSTLREGVGYKMSSYLGARHPQGRWQVRVYTDSTHAKRSNAQHNTLLRSLSRG